MPEYITFNCMMLKTLLKRMAGTQPVFAVFRLLALVSLASASAIAQVPCPPQLGDGAAAPCGAPLDQQSGTPDYQDPLADCSSLRNLNDVSVATASALKNALTNATCGDFIQLAPGMYISSFSLSKSCPAENPIIIKGAADFGSTISGGTFQLGGSHNIVTGIRFANQGNQIRLGGTNNKILANQLTDWRGIAVSMKSGKQGEVAYNEFYKPHAWVDNEDGSYPLRMGIRTSENSSSDFHFDAWIHHNHFHDFPQKPDPDVYSSGQSDAIEVCRSPSNTETVNIKSGWYIEENLIQRHLGTSGIVDLKCGGVVLRRNTVIDSPNGRLDQRGGSYSAFESNWQENSGGSNIHGGHHRIIGNYMRGGSGIVLVSGNVDWNQAVTSSNGHARAYNVLIAGNDTNELLVGRSNNATTTVYPTLDTRIEGHLNSKPKLTEHQRNTTIDPTTSAKFSSPVKLAPGQVGPAAMSRASAAYLECRSP